MRINIEANSSLLLLFIFKSNHKRLVKCLFHAKIRRKYVNGLSPPILLISSHWCIICLLSFRLSTFIEMTISFCFLIILVLAVFQFIQSMSLFYRVVLILKNREIVRIWVGLHQSLHFYVGTC